jgi:hypothetical protein
VKIQVEVLWVLTPCSFAVEYQSFGGPGCLHFQGEVKGKYANFLIAIRFTLKTAGARFSETVLSCCQHYTALQPKKRLGLS